MNAQPLTKDEVKALLAACPDTNTGIRDRALFTALWRGSMRITATLHIRPADIDWDRGLVAIQQDKGGKGRTAVLDAQAMDVLRIWAERRKSLGINGHHPFFCVIHQQSRGNLLRASHYRRLIKKLQEEAGIEKRCYLHVLRHTGASEMAEEGLGLPTISVQLGHRHVATTSRYIHILRPDLSDARLRERTW
jgi:integrase/recombinase XerD